MGECKLGICCSPVILWRSLSQISGVKASLPPALSEYVTFPFSHHMYVISKACMSQLNIKDVGNDRYIRVSSMTLCFRRIQMVQTLF